MFDPYQDWSTNEPVAILGILPLYGIFVLTGFLVTCGWAFYFWNKKGYKAFEFVFMATFVAVFALYGAKIWYMVFSPVDTFSNVQSALDFFTLLLIPAFGRSILGTIICTPIGVVIWRRVWASQYSKLELLDIVMPAMLIGQAIGRWGNMYDHNVYGKVVSEDQISWLPNYIQAHMFIDGEYRQPLFLFESMVDLIGASCWLIIMASVGEEKMNKGTGFSYYFLFYGITRLIFEPMRDHRFWMTWGENFDTTILWATIFVAIGIIGLIFFNIRNKYEKVNTNKGV